MSSPNITFTRSTIDEAAALLQAQIAAFHHDSVLYPDVEIGGPPGYDSLEDTSKKIQADACYTIADAGQVIGGFVVYPMEHEHVHLGLIFIHPAYQDRGIGTRAMQFIEQTYPAKRWSLDTPAWAIRNQHFYEKSGYVKLREDVLPDITLFVYEKQLS